MPLILKVVVSSERVLQTEWVETPERIDKSQQVIQQEFFSRFSESPSLGFLYLGFCDKNVPLSESLAFWRSFCDVLAEELRLTPDIETLRHRVELPIVSEHLDRIVDGAPPMTGAEYIDSALLEGLWSGLLQAFRSQIKAYHGSVEEFLSALSPDIHLVGRVYFHLVENKRGGVPFAFLATYSTSLGAKGESRHIPLRHALQEHGADSKKLLELLATVRLAAADSTFISGMLESGERKLHEAIRCACEERIESLEALLSGEFPKELGEVFTAKERAYSLLPKKFRSRAHARIGHPC